MEDWPCNDIDFGKDVNKIGRDASEKRADILHCINTRKKDEINDEFMSGDVDRCPETCMQLDGVDNSDNSYDCNNTIENVNDELHNDLDYGFLLLLENKALENEGGVGDYANDIDQSNTLP